MRPQPLADLGALDLTREVVSLEDFRKVVLQRGRFALIDGVVHADVENDLIVGYKDILADDWWAADHIPGRPLFPGALMVEASAQLSTYDFVLRRPEISHKFVGFAGIDKTRFRAKVEPDCRMYFVSRAARLRKTLFNYKVQGLVEGAIVFEGEVSGMVV